MIQKKQIKILRHNGGQLGNQLLLFMSVYAYCLEKGFDCINYSFYEYGKYFNFKTPNFYFKIFELISKFKFYKSHALIYILYRYSTNIITFFEKGIILKADPEDIFYLPPTVDSNKSHTNTLHEIEASKNKKIYIDGWTFRNPLGLKKYRELITKKFRPKFEIIKKVKKFIKNIKKDYYLVGVHIRQGEYKNKNFMAGEWYFNEKEVVEILKSYLEGERKNSKKVLFLLCSDGPIDLALFPDLNVILGLGSTMQDLMALSMCDVILGSNSTFGSFAAYYGNIPFFVFDRKQKYIKGMGKNLFQ